MISKAPLLIWIFFFFALTSRAQEVLDHGPDKAAKSYAGCVVVPNRTNTVQFRIYTNASPQAFHLFNTFDLEAFGQKLVQSPLTSSLTQALAGSTSGSLIHSILINGRGPNLSPAHAMTVAEQASGPEWLYVRLDGGAAYEDRLKLFRRSLLFVEPDLFVLYDHAVAKESASFEFILHPPAAAEVDTVWRDLRLDVPGTGLRIQAPSTRRGMSNWKRIMSPADALLPGTITMELGPDKPLTEVNQLIVFAVYRQSEKKEYTCKLLESNTAIGLRIHRDGLPALVAFRRDEVAGEASLTGFPFHGPVGVHLFKPKQTH